MSSPQYIAVMVYCPLFSGLMYHVALLFSKVRFLGEYCPMILNVTFPVVPLFVVA